MSLHPEERCVDPWTVVIVGVVVLAWAALIWMVTVLALNALRDGPPRAESKSVRGAVYQLTCYDGILHVVDTINQESIQVIGPGNRPAACTADMIITQ